MTMGTVQSVWFDRRIELIERACGLDGACAKAKKEMAANSGARDMEFGTMTVTRRHAALTFAMLSCLVVLPATLSAGAEETIIDVAVEGGKLVGDDKSVRVTEGDAVTVRLMSDTAIEVHLHGYDIEAAVVPGAVTELTFEAFATGRFPVSVHSHDHGESTLMYIEVYPR